MTTPAESAEQYRTALLEECIPFWMRHSIDREYGGYFTCLDREGRVYDTDKFVWLQARQVWTFSMLYNEVEKRDDWLRIARHGADFLRKYGADLDGNWYFALNREGKALVQPYNIASDCFAAMAFGQYGVAAADEEAKEIARRTYQNILKRRDNPKGQYNKAIPGTRALKPLGFPMILCNLALELEGILEPGEIERRTLDSVEEIMNLFLDKKKGLFYECIRPDGGHEDCFDGRLINPGHGIEATWFVMDVARRRDDRKTIGRAARAAISTLEFAWDPEHGGIYYFLDAAGYPPQQLEWDQKLWWVHLEALIALAMGYALLKDGTKAEADLAETCLRWYGKVCDWTWPRFSDPEHGEWFGYLNRRGEILLPTKGGKWKGCFHVPRAFYRLWKVFESLTGRAS